MKRTLRENAGALRSRLLARVGFLDPAQTDEIVDMDQYGVASQAKGKLQ
jgi:hypothetical protein